MALNWLENGFICRNLCSPFVVKMDNEYLPDLENRYNTLLKQAEVAGADGDSLRVLEEYEHSVLESLYCYYRADISGSNEIIEDLLRGVGSDPLASGPLSESMAFPGAKGSEIQFFRSRKGDPSCSYIEKDMLHLPRSLRAKTGNYRFSIPGNPSFYLSNSSYGCWIETGFPPENEFNVAPVILDEALKVFNLAVSVRNHAHLDGFGAARVQCWLKLLVLMIATSYRVEETGRLFKSEYVVSQAIMVACKKMGYDGVAYLSKRVPNEVFSYCAINLALFVEYEEEYSSVARRVKLGKPLNYSVFKQLKPSLRYKSYELRSVNNALVVNMGDFDRQHPYRETEFYDYDVFLFSEWKDRGCGKGKDVASMGNAVPHER